MRTSGDCISAIDIIQDVFGFTSKKEAAKKLAKYKGVRKNASLNNLRREAFTGNGRNITYLEVISSWCELLGLLQSCRKKYLIVNFIERNAEVLRLALGHPPLVSEEILKHAGRYGASSLRFLQTCQAIILNEDSMETLVYLLPLRETLFLDDLIDDLGQAFNHKYTIERSKYKSEDCRNVRYIRLACEARGKPSARHNKKRVRDSIKCLCKSVCTLKGKVDQTSGRILVVDLPSLNYIHSHDCISPQSGIFRPLHPELEVFILEHRCMTLQMGDLRRLCWEKGLSLATKCKEHVQDGPDARFKPTITQIKNVLKRNALKTWRKGNDQSNLRAKGLGMARDGEAFVFFRESRELQVAPHGQLKFFSPSSGSEEDIWVYQGSRKGDVPYVSTVFLPNAQPLAPKNSNGRQRFLFLWMTKHGRYMLERYGCWVGLDSTYRLNMYGFPLSILVVKTNIGNAFPVCFYLSDLEDTCAHEEAIALVKWICPNWCPETVLSDCAMELVHAIESNFPSATCIWCHFHVEQALLRHVKKKQVNIGKELDKQKIISFMHALLYAKTKVAFQNVEVEFIQHVQHFGFKGTEVYYLQYLKKYEMRWAMYARNDNRCCGHVKNINTNNLNESFNGKLKQHFGLKRNKLVTSLVMKLMNVANMFWTDYVHANTMQSNPYRTIYMKHNIIPSADLCAVRRPDIVLRYLAMNQKKGQTNKYKFTQILTTNGDSWLLVGNRFTQYKVTRNNRSWTCTCVNSARARIPCHHIFATLHHAYLDFSDVDLLAPHFVIDEECVECPGGHSLEVEVINPRAIHVDASKEDNAYQPESVSTSSGEVGSNDADEKSRQVVMDHLRALRSNFFEVSQLNPHALALYRDVLKVIENYVMVPCGHYHSSITQAQNGVLSTTKRLYDSTMENISPGHIARMIHCIPLVAALREVTQGALPTLGTPKSAKKRRKKETEEPSLLPMEKFMKTRQQTYSHNQRTKVVRTLSQLLHDKASNQEWEDVEEHALETLKQD